MSEVNVEQSAYIDGYFSERFRNGDTPVYGYPSNHLPEPKTEKMTVVTGFMASSDDDS